jgi:tetratricopeptide (TPR) repeat protein
VRTIALIVTAATAALLSLWIPDDSIAGRSEEQVCDVSADYALGVEDYATAIRLHVELVHKHPDNALAHYHLGFALGMTGSRTAEIGEYRRAAALGLANWDLFLNLGLALIENGDLDGATSSLQRAVRVGENHPEAHFNLALLYQRRRMLADAEHETAASLQLNPDQPDARNLLGVIYAQQGDISLATLTWRELTHDIPDYEPARTNLAVLSLSKVATGETAAVNLPRATAVDTIMDER